MGKRGGKRETIRPIVVTPKIITAKNILFLLVALLIIILIIYLVVKAWPLMQEKLKDDDKDGIKNYQDKCPNTPKGAVVDSYGCGTMKQEGKQTILGQIPSSGNETITSTICADSDGGKNIWTKGTCKDGVVIKKDSCKEDFEKILYEYECFSNGCSNYDVNCEDYSALCYDGRCIEKTKDSDKDGIPDLDEYKNGTDPNNPNDFGKKSSCQTLCLGLGYIRGTGPVESLGKCDPMTEVGKFLSGNSGDVCCCKDCGMWCGTSGWTYGTVTTKSNCNTYPTNHYDDSLGCCCHMEKTGGGQENQSKTYTKSECGNLATQKGYKEYEIKTGDVYKWIYGGYSVSKATCKEYAEFQCMGSDIKKYEEENNCCMWTCIVGCIDSDAGDDMYTAGYVKDYNKDIGGYNIIADKCREDDPVNKIGESECVADQHIFSIHTCPYGCEQVKVDNIQSARCKAYVNPNTGLDCSSKAVTPTSQADCSLRKGCPADTYCKFSSNVCYCAWEEDCIDSDFAEGYRYLEIYKHKGYCMEDNIIGGWDTCANGKLIEWGCSPTVSCESFEVNCAEWFEGGYCEDGICKITVYPAPHYLTEYRANGHPSCPATCKKDQPCTVDATKVFSVATGDYLKECQIAIGGLGIVSTSGPVNALTFTMMAYIGSKDIYITCKNSQGLWDDNHGIWDDNPTVGSIICKINVVL